MAPRRRRSRSSERARPGVLGGLLADATDVLQSVANEVAPGVVTAIDVNGVVERVDIQGVVDRVDLQEVLERVDLNALLEQVDIEKLLEKVDIEKLLERVDINKVLSRVDIDGMIQRTEIGSIIASTGAGIASKAVDVARSQGVGVDVVVQRWADKILRRRSSSGTQGTPLPVDEAEEAEALSV